MANAYQEEHFGVLKDNYSRGPFGLGDPDDLTLRKVEKEILIPQKMKEIAKREHCSTEVQSFGECAKQAGLLLTFQCRDKANLLHTCLSNMYKKEEFVERCTQEYLKDRTEYRRTGKKKLIKRV
ncbi:COX assembly mitochondrial protein homolog isoform X2 [Octopus bimaculoides]|uniref:COX assembly mitochondrial protein n=1 Tax=Octopus bimaculoides TaxID=37653 RepID=A0A0L8GGN5_OCTBM|nr:COX assembly mitochondrial protein homolog isoform X2 [Octopus bimaculoides]|eukprot:XP_014781208.1 PREDICTED: COX assembly mitochondrial protein homolog [Octopus bimaculoides]